MISFAYAESIRAACELLHDLATHQAQNHQHPLAPIAAQWLDHVGAVAAREGCAVALPHALTLPPAGVMQ